MGVVAQTNCRLETGGNAKCRSTVHSGTGSRVPSGARGVAVAYAEDRTRVFRENESSEVEQTVRRPVAGSNPVRSPLDSSVG